MAALVSAGQLLLLFTPTALSVAAVAGKRLWLLLPAALLLLALVRFLPLCRGDEVPWAVLLTASTGLPANLLPVQFLWELLWQEMPLWAAALRGALALYVLFSVEALFLGLLACLLRKQPN